MAVTDYAPLYTQSACQNSFVAGQHHATEVRSTSLAADVDKTLKICRTQTEVSAR